jgi:hypothetical protein
MHYITEIRSPLSEWRASDTLESDCKLIVHVSNAWSHTARLSVKFVKDNRMKTAPHPPYSSNIAAADVDLFGHVKGSLAGRSFVDAEERFEAVRRHLTA